MIAALRQALLAAGLSDVMAEEVIAVASTLMALDQREQVLASAINWLSWKRGWSDFQRYNANSPENGEYWGPNVQIAEDILTGAIDDLTAALAQLRLKH